MLFYIYISIVALAFVSSLISFKLNYPFHFKLFSVLLGITLLTEIGANFFLKSLHLKFNTPVYNVFMLIEFWVYAYYYLQIIKNTTVKKIIKAFLFLFPIFWGITIFYLFDGLEEWNSYLIIIGFFFTVLWSIIYCFQLFTSDELIQFRYTIEFWIAIGLIIFYTCNLPYLGMYNFLVNYHERLAQQLKKVLQPTDCLMYSLFIYAYLCRMKINTKKYSQ